MRRRPARKESAWDGPAWGWLKGQRQIIGMVPANHDGSESDRVVARTTQLPPSFRLEVRGLEQLGAAGKVVRDELRESLRGLRGGLDAERRKAAFRAKLFRRIIHPAIDRLDEILWHAGRSPHRPPRTEIQCGKPELGHGGDLRRKRAAPSAAQPDGPHASGAHQWQQGENGLDHRRHMPAYNVVRSRRSAAINDDRQIEPGVLVEGNGREMTGRAEL